MFMCQSIRQCSAYGKHPAGRVLVSPDGHVPSGSNVTNACIHSEACMVDLTWALVRMPPLKLFGVVGPILLNMVMSCFDLFVWRTAMPRATCLGILVLASGVQHPEPALGYAFHLMTRTLLETHRSW